MKYGHIIDPSTGYPAENGVLSVTIVSTDGTLADALSTTLFVMGEEKAEQYWRTAKEKYGYDFDFIIETEDEKLYVTEGIADDFETDYDVVTVER